MTSTQLSSGDLIADRRADYAHMLAEGGEYVEAAELMEQALEQAPGWAAGWFLLAEYAEKSGRKEAAAAALSKVLVLDPGDLFGARLKLAVLGQASVPDQPSSRYVERLFDDYAERFDEALVEKLAYSVPEKLARLVIERADGKPRYERLIDIGCGTGLFGERFRDHAAYLEGFDLSANMLAKAAQKGVYGHLGQADLLLSPEACGVFGEGRPEHRADIVSAADVLMYLGDLSPAFAIAAHALCGGGLFAFSVEDGGTDSGDGYVIRPSLRYAHTEAFVRQCALKAGFSMLAAERTVIRMDAGEAVHGLLFLARANA
ncbi:methyltransferase [Sinorhizobium sp. BG8]|uniref:methyltransferase domain-containing protein n=1 Tax=Sinorhizobium sp. BG8 TaxID=2613773 RepID=UPI00193D1EAD|nr:methyltransferase [Sinorhizobium sp. BG8]QRM54136.1 methyltransferase domain-containing protein [Sinorhizobium sp. BG8]